MPTTFFKYREYAGTVFTYFGNGNYAKREYSRRYSTRRLPAKSVFSRLKVTTYAKHYM